MTSQRAPRECPLDSHTIAPWPRSSVGQSIVLRRANANHSRVGQNSREITHNLRISPKFNSRGEAPVCARLCPFGGVRTGVSRGACKPAFGRFVTNRVRPRERGRGHLLELNQGNDVPQPDSVRRPCPARDYGELDRARRSPGARAPRSFPRTGRDRASTRATPAIPTGQRRAACTHSCLRHGATACIRP